MRAFRPYLKYLRPVRGKFILGLILGLIAGVASGGTVPVMLERVFGALLNNRSAELSTWQLIGYASLLPAVFLVRGLSNMFNTYLISLCGVRVLEQIRTEYFAKLQALPLGFFARRSTGDLISRGMSDTNQLQVVLTKVANDGVVQPVTLVSAVTILIVLAWRNHDILIILVSFGLIPLCVFPIRHIGKKLLRRARQMQEQMGDVQGHFTENLGALREVRAFGLEARETARFADKTRSLFRVQMKVVKYAASLSPLIEIIAATGIAVSFIYAYRAGITSNVFIALGGALYMAYDPIKKMGLVNNELRKGQSALARLEEILHAPIAITDPATPTPIARLRGELAFAAVAFDYGPEAPALRDVSVVIPAGTVCALVGPSGAGKSTFANLVLRFYDATAGTVSIDRISVRDMRLADLRQNIALVSQEPILFNDTIHNNILLGRMDATRDEVEAAARDAQAHEFITSLAQGYNTLAGERGSSLSGGQRQRIALARAFLRHAPILILDEANSALDSETEAAVQQALRKLVVGKTVLIVAHRFSTIRDASLILVFDQGRIIAQGNHDSLYADNRLYRSLYDTQQGGA